MDIELAQALEENAKLKMALSNLVYVVKLGKNELATARILDKAEQLLEDLKINPNERFEVTEKDNDLYGSLFFPWIEDYELPRENNLFISSNL